MSKKYGRSEVPPNHSLSDFECFGPPALQDGQFENTKIADLGCFNQEGVDSNKYYHGAMVKSSKTSKWYVYLEWGRTGKTPDFQFVECDDEAEAQEVYAEQLHSKSTKRGEMAVIAGVTTLRAKPGKDCYLVRPQSTRSTGLPDARKIQATDGKPAAKASAAGAAAKGAKAVPKADQQTLRLMRDLNVATVNYTKGAMATGSIPTQGAIDDGRKILDAARKRLVVVGNDVDDQVKDKELKELTNVLYGKIPKVKSIGAAPETWILSANNILAWDSDFDAFESAGQTTAATTDLDPFGGMPIDMSWIDPASSIGEFLQKWAPTATRNSHGYGKMVVQNMWRVARHGDEPKLFGEQDRIAAAKARWSETPLHQPKGGRPEMKAERVDAFQSSHTTMLFHGTRSVNVSGILRKNLMLPSQLVGVVISGAMFGPGLYFADDWQKSAGYTSLSGSRWSAGSGGVQGRHAFMFVADVVLGNPYVSPADGGYTEAPKGHHCVFGKGGHTRSWGGRLMNNEWIVYKNNQQMLRYLLEFSTR